VILKYSNPHFNQTLDSYGTVFAVFMTMCQFYNPMEAYIFDVVTPEDFGITNKSEENWEEYANAIK
jgi:hypothetical protein